MNLRSWPDVTNARETEEKRKKNPKSKDHTISTTLGTRKQPTA